MDVEREVRRVLDEPAPPDPPDAVEDDDHGGGPSFGCRPPLVVLHQDGSLYADGFAGSMVIAWWYLASFATIGLLCYAVIATLLAHAAAVTWLVLVTLAVAIVALIAAAILVRVVPWWRDRRTRRQARKPARRTRRAGS